jgi:multidrug efflux pump
LKLSTISIHRPVLAMVLTMALILFGLLSFTHLPIREYPDIEAPVVSIRAVYPGASAHIVETDVTTVLEESLSGLESVKAMTSTSREEVSQISVEFQLSRDLDAAANDVRDRVFSVRRSLPMGIEEPIIAKSSAETDAILWLSLQSDRHSDLEISDYAERHIKDRLGTLPDVAAVWLWGSRRYAMRVWLDADRLAARQLTVQEVEAALRSQNVAIPSGRIESDRTEFSVRTRGELQTSDQFNQLILAYRDGHPTRLEDVGHAELGAEDDRMFTRFNGQPILGVGIVKQSKGNTLAVARAVKDRLQAIQESLPEGMKLQIASDSSQYIERSLHEAYVALGLSMLLVVLVIFAFLGNIRATIIPAVAIPASVISTFTAMHLFGFTINVLTLLGLVLAVGLVVDDAIVMLENIHRRMELGQGPLQAAVEGSREIGFAVIATTLSLVSVFVPIAFLGGTVGRLFAELALAVAAAVLISGFIALTLTPAMSARLLRVSSTAAETNGDRYGWGGRIAGCLRGLLMVVDERVRQGFGWLADFYRRILERTLLSRGLVLASGLAAMALGGLLFLGLGSELVPQEDVAGFSVRMSAPEGSTIRYTDHYARQIEALLAAIPEADSYWTWVATGLKPSVVSRAGSWISLKPWEDRKRGQQEIVAEINEKLASVSGVAAAATNPSALSQVGQASIQLVIRGPSYEELERIVGILLDKAKSHGGLVNPETDLNLNKPGLDVHVDRNKAADLGVSIASIGRTLETLLGGRTVTTFDRDGKEYPVIVKIHGERRVAPSDIRSLYVRGNQGELVQLSNLVTIDETAVPRELSHYDRLRSAKVKAGVAYGHTLGEALSFLEQAAKDLAAPGVSITFAGESREFKEGTLKLYLTFLIALVVIYLVLAAEFESFVHPLTILVSVPPALTGALLCLLLRGGTLNIYSEIGLIMLIGLVTKNAILIVDFAIQLQSRYQAPVQAVIEAASLRLRPILMTTLATVLGAIPLALATGAGANGRQQLGMVIIGGLLFSTLLTLFIVPAMYVVLARPRIPRGATPRAELPQPELLTVR